MENRRIQITKRMLKEALLELLEEKDIKKITIYELCERANINRTTFYKYYGSQYDLFEEIENDVFHEITQRMEGEESSVAELLLRLTEYFEEDRKKFCILLNSTADTTFAEKLFSLPLMKDQINLYIPASYTPQQREYIYAFIYGGGGSILRKWLNSDTPVSAREIVYIILGFIENLTALDCRLQDNYEH